jgi:hypothetical protein
MTRTAAVIALVIAVTGCALVSSQEPVANVRELAGPWRGRLATQLANAAATMTVDETGAYTGALHAEGGEDRPFQGAIVVVRPGRLRYQGSHGNGIVMVTSRDGVTELRFVPDGGGGGGAFTRAR